MVELLEQLIQALRERGALSLFALFFVARFFVRTILGALRKGSAVEGSAVEGLEGETTRPSPPAWLRPLLAAQMRELAGKVSSSSTAADRVEVSDVALPELADRVHSLSDVIHHDRRLARLRQRYEDYVEEPVSALSASAVGGHRGSSSAKAVGGERAVGVDRMRLRALVRRQERYEMLVRERTEPQWAERIMALEEVANAALEPLSDFARAEGPGLPADVVTVHLVDRPPLSGPSAPEDDHLLLLPVAHTLGSDVLDYDVLLEALGTRLFFDVRGLSDQVHGALGLAPGPKLPPVGHSYDAASAAAVLGASLPALFGEVFASLRGGPAHGLALLKRLESAPEPTRFERHMDGYAAQPPALLQLRVCTQVLRHQDFDGAADALWRRFVARHGEALQTMHLPLRQDREVLAPADYYLDLSDRLVQLLLDEPIAGLDDYRLTEIPGLCHLQGAADRREAETARVLLGRPPSAGRPLIAALAVFGALDGELSRQTLTALLRLALADGSTDERKAAQARALGATSLRASLRDRAAIREAMVLDTALTPRRSGRRR